MGIRFKQRLAVVLAIGLVTAMGSITVGQIVSPIVATRGQGPRVNHLVNHSVGAHPDSPVDPSRPTMVITHGWNPLPNHIQLTTPAAYAGRIRARMGGKVNVLAWNWDSRNRGTPNANNASAMASGSQLGNELLRRGVVPARTVLIGHSMGAIAVTAAANEMRAHTGQQVAELMLLDAPAGKFELVYDLLFRRCTNRVRNFWAGGHGGLGAPMDFPGVENVAAPERDSSATGGPVARINHVDILLWFYENYL